METLESAASLSESLERARADYAALKAKQLKLDLTRGKPSPAQLDLADAMLTLPGDTYTATDGTDCRNYGGNPLGLPELRAIFAPVLQVPADQLLAVGNSSLEADAQRPGARPAQRPAGGAAPLGGRGQDRVPVPRSRLRPALRRCASASASR